MIIMNRMTAAHSMITIHIVMMNILIIIRMIWMIKWDNMIQYQNKTGNSNIQSYEIGFDYIDVKFFGTQKIYRYSYDSAGEEKVEYAKSLAQQGYGLNSFIMRHMKYEYEK